MIEVFFDGKCGLCSKEIAYYQRIAPSGIFVWLDIATDASPLAAHQISQADALRYLVTALLQDRTHQPTHRFNVRLTLEGAKVRALI